MADSSCVTTFPSLFTTTTKNPYRILSVPSKPIKLNLSCSHSSLFSPCLSQKNKTQSSSIATFVAQTSNQTQSSSIATFIAQTSNKTQSSSIATSIAQTSDWPQQEEGNPITIDTEDCVSGSEAKGEDSVIEGIEAKAESSDDGVFKETEEHEDQFVEPPEEAKFFVGNFPYDVDSQKLAMHFEQAGIVEIAKVIYNRETDQSHGFGIVMLSTVEEAEKRERSFFYFLFSILFFYSTIYLPLARLTCIQQNCI